MTFFEILNSVWNFSVFYAKYILIVLLIYTMLKYNLKNNGFNILKILRQAFVHNLFVKGEFIVYSIITGGLINYLTQNFILSTILFAVIFLYGLFMKNDHDKINLSRFKEIVLNSFLILMFIIAISALFLNNPILNNLSSLAIYAILFWRV